MSDSVKKVALIGVGGISHVYSGLLPEFPKLKLATIVDVNQARAKEASKGEIPYYLDVERMLAEKQHPDFAIICTPPSTHLEIVKPLLHAGVDCLIEKPMAIKLKDAQEMQQLADSLGRTIAVSMKYRYTQNLNRASQMILDHEIGKLQFVENIFSGELNLDGSWRINPKISGGGVWMDNGPHSLDVVQTIAGEIQRIKISKAAHIQQKAVEDEVMVDLEHDNGIQSRVLLSWNRQIPAPIARCVGSDGELIVGWNEIVCKRAGHEEKLQIGYDKKDSFKSVIVGFLDKCDQKLQNDDHGLKSVGWLDAGYRSLQSGQWENLP